MSTPLDWSEQGSAMLARRAAGEAAPKLHVIGVDLSMQATGLAIIRPQEGYHRVHLVKSKPLPKEERGADPYPDLFLRLRGIGKVIRARGFEHRGAGDLTLCVIEGPALDLPTEQQRHTMAWLWGRTYEILSREGAVVVVPPSSLKRYVTGNGGAGKELMKQAATGRAFPHVDFRPPRSKLVDDNLVDAYGLAAMGCRQLGSPVEPSVQRCWPDALSGAHWHRPRPSTAPPAKGTP